MKVDRKEVYFPSRKCSKVNAKDAEDEGGMPEMEGAIEGTAERGGTHKERGV